MQTRARNSFASPFAWLDVDRVLDQVFDATRRPFPGRERFPVANVWESQDAFHVEAEVPGVAEDDLEILVEKSSLTLRGRRAPSGETDGLLRTERATGDFTRTFTLPAELDAEHVEAKLTNGLLAITLPKAAELRPRRIAVKAS